MQHCMVTAVSSLEQRLSAVPRLSFLQPGRTDVSSKELAGVPGHFKCKRDETPTLSTSTTCGSPEVTFNYLGQHQSGAARTTQPAVRGLAPSTPGQAAPEWNRTWHQPGGGQLSLAVVSRQLAHHGRGARSRAHGGCSVSPRDASSIGLFCKSQPADTVLKAGGHLRESHLPCPSEIGNSRERTSLGGQRLGLCVPTAGPGARTAQAAWPKTRRKAAGWGLDSPPALSPRLGSALCASPPARGAAGRPQLCGPRTRPGRKPNARLRASPPPASFQAVPEPPQRLPCLRREQTQPSVPPAWGRGNALSAGGLAGLGPARAGSSRCPPPAPRALPTRDALPPPGGALTPRCPSSPPAPLKSLPVSKQSYLDSFSGSSASCRDRGTYDRVSR
ncbi:unnamed protein product [Rangifer tarandus platyrhynchus]|uniref:Uncharacterized protein n=1 Tax=Rangifer tarandus platyrhynchus TaxID=3082113 RepID=A0ABN8ZDE9_RANTA|nr:unnamed protein product [Rangifer tarandus platyrhynchus]